MSSQCRRPSLSAYATARPLSFLLPSYCSLHAAWLLCPLTAAGNSGPFWEMLVLLACCDKSTIVALEAIKGLAGLCLELSWNDVCAVNTLECRPWNPALFDVHRAAVRAAWQTRRLWRLLACSR